MRRDIAGVKKSLLKFIPKEEGKPNREEGRIRDEIGKIPEMDIDTKSGNY